MKITSRNVNGIRAVLQKGFAEWVKSDNADMYCFQETKAFEHQVPQDVLDIFDGYSYCWHAGTRPGYAGTAIFRRNASVSDVVSCNTFGDNTMFHEDGRITEINFTSNGSDYTLINGYFPNGGTRADGTEMVSYKLKFYDHLIAYIQQKQGQHCKVIVVGDYNVCHNEIDIARPKENENSIGFLPIERDKVSEYLQKADMVDVFRYFHPDATDAYTWWSYRAGARPRNVGRRIDYATVSSNMIDQVQSFVHQADVMGSDHCPISLTI